MELNIIKSDQQEKEENYRKIISLIEEQIKVCDKIICEYKKGVERNEISN